MRSLAIKVNIEYPQDMSELLAKAADIMSDILIKKLQPKEIKKLIELLEDEKTNITW